MRLRISPDNCLVGKDFRIFGIQVQRNDKSFEVIFVQHEEADDKGTIVAVDHGLIKSGSVSMVCSMSTGAPSRR